MASTATVTIASLSRSSQYLLLQAAPADFQPSPPGQLSGYPYYKRIEAAGHSHQSLVEVFGRRRAGLSDHEEKVAVEKAVDDMPTKVKLTPAQLLAVKDDLYALLGLETLRWKATQAQLKKAYRAAVLMHHPDKQAQVDDEVDDEVFKAIADAYTTLSDETKRRAYDSTDPFDDKLPSEREIEAAAKRGAKHFYSLLQPVFLRNAKWSKITPVPDLGDDSTSLDDVHAFYEFWFTLKSWRDFSSTHEYTSKDLDEAESREEKRWMERQNRGKSAKLLKAEKKRLTTLVEMSERHDPRIRAWKKQLEDERLEKKRQRQAAKRAKWEEANKAEEEERQRKEAEAKAAEEEAKNLQKQAAAGNKAKRKLKAKLRANCRKARAAAEEGQDMGFVPDVDQVEVLCNALEVEQLKAITKAQLADLASASSTLEELMARIEGREVKKVEKKEQKKPWSDDEVAILAKALQKYPTGTLNRWEVVAALLPGREVKEIIVKTKERQAMPCAAPASAGAHKIKGKPVPKPKEVPKKEEPKKEEPKKEEPKKEEPKKEEPKKEEPKKEEPKKEAKREEKQAELKKEEAKKPEPTKEAKEAEKPKAADPEAWSAEEQLLLEAAMKKHPSGKERWGLIAEELPGRSRADVVARYKYLVAFFKKQKAQQ